MASNLTRFDPLRNIEDFFKDFALAPSWQGTGPEPRIRMDVKETDQNYVVKAEIPGVKKDDIHIAVDGNKVTIQAEVKDEKEAKEDGTTVRSERYYGQQYRSFTLPQEVDDEKAEAKYQDGVLSLVLPKKSGTGGRQLTIQ